MCGHFPCIKAKQGRSLLDASGPAAALGFFFAFAPVIGVVLVVAERFMGVAAAAQLVEAVALVLRAQRPTLFLLDGALALTGVPGLAAARLAVPSWSKKEKMKLLKTTITKKKKKR